ncbi:hypothetical protein ONZ45_g4974 [Pleurotus djamor]|nr:hypothetical protein ONZ45_g4974 [Pleurotus djamor]
MPQNSSEEYASLFICAWKGVLHTQWISSNRAALLAMSYSRLITVFQDKMLGFQWNVKLAQSIRDMSQGSLSFGIFHNAVCSKNALLVGNEKFNSEEDLRNILHCRMDEKTRSECASLHIHDLDDFDEWLREVENVDDRLRRDRKDQRKTMLQLIQDSYRVAPPPSSHRTVYRAPAPEQRSGLQLPKITPTERVLLSAHTGCFKCRRFYAVFTLYSATELIGTRAFLVDIAYEYQHDTIFNNFNHP